MARSRVETRLPGLRPVDWDLGVSRKLSSLLVLLLLWSPTDRSIDLALVLLRLLPLLLLF